MPATPLRKYHELDGRTFLVGVGAAKCATSWVYGYLEALPGVTVSPLKELHFFNARGPSGSDRMNRFALKRLALHVRQDGDVIDNLRSRASFQASIDRVKMIYDEDQYFGHFARLCRPETRTLCDITPAYAALGRAGFEEMKAFFASQDAVLKIVFIMRDPVDRLWSLLRYRQQSDTGFDALKDWSGMIEDPEIVAGADYRQTIEALDTVFAGRDVLFLFYEDLFCAAALRQLSAFAGAHYMPADTDEVVNETPLMVELPGKVRDELQARLAPQYAFCRQRFGDLVPDAWRA